MDKKTLILRVALLGAQLIAGCAQMNEPSTLPAYGVTPPGYVSPAFGDATGSEISPVLWWARAVPSVEPVTEAAPRAGVADIVAESAVRLVGSFVHAAIPPAKKERRSTIVVAAPAPQIHVHRVERRERHHAPPRLAQHKPSQHRPAGNKSAPAKGSKKK